MGNSLGLHSVEGFKKVIAENPLTTRGIESLLASFEILSITFLPCSESLSFCFFDNPAQPFHGRKSSLRIIVTEIFSKGLSHAKENLIHEIGHAFYGVFCYREFKCCEPYELCMQTIELEAVRFCKENPAYVDSLFNRLLLNQNRGYQV